jgi:WD40 repeat protein/energy-coupling factor transporter ATP-binding protein EcfA2
MDDENEKDQAKVHAEDNSVAVGSISAGGDISGSIHIGNVYQTPEDDIPLSSEEIENGLTRFAIYLPERAPILQDQFSSIAKKLRATLGADQNSLSPALKAQREDGVNRMKLICMEVTDISFRAICLGQNPPPYDSRPPFLGLFAFHPEDREFFFGREALVQKLVARFKEHPFLAVLGASGSGKSSLVMAGLIPALEAEMSYLTPSTVPLYQLLEAKESASANTIFVIDQFEELFTHPHDAAERADFIHELLELTKTNRVVVTMRADFWGEVAVYTELKQAMQEHQELIAPMNVDKLHAAMEKQAAVVGLRFDPTLSESILAEVKDEPGAMPLLQHTLWELWNRRHGLWIKAEEYQAFGGVKQAIASTAEEVYASCSDFERDRVRDIFLRLTRLDPDGSGEGRDTRRRVLIEELIPANSDSSVTIKLLNKLADARLVVKTDKDVEVAHEALIRHWSRLTNWLNEDRNNLILREGVSESARDWENSDRDDSLLNHRGGRLELALAMSRLPRYQLNPIEQAYLDAGTALRNKEQREREKRLRWTVTASIAAAVIFLILGSFGLIKSNEATAQAAKAQANADAAATAQSKAEEQAKIALARQLAAQSISLIGKNSSVSWLLGIEAFEQLDTVETHAALLDNVQFNYQLLGFLNGHRAAVRSAAFSPDGKILVSGSNDKTIILWDVVTRQPIGQPLTGTGIVHSIAFSLDGKMFATGSDNHTVVLWDVATRQPIGPPLGGHTDWVSSVAFSPDGRTLASSSNDGTVILWDVTTRQPIGQPLSADEGAVYSIAFSPDGKTVASAVSGNSIILWDPATRQRIGQPLRGHTAAIASIAFSSDGKTLASGGYDNTIILWNVETQQPIEAPLTDHAGFVYSVTFSPDGQILASASGDKTIILWDLKTRRPIDQPLRGHTNSVDCLTFSGDGKTLASGSFDNTLILWDVSTAGKSNVATRQPIGRTLAVDRGFVSTIAFSPDGKTIASVSYDNTILFWDVDTRQVINELRNKQVGIISLAFSPEGKILASGSGDSTIVLWDVTTLRPIGEPLHNHTSRVSSVAFSPDGKILASGSWDHIIILWDVATRQPIGRPLIGHTADVLTVAFSPDGRTLASGGSDGLVVFWEVATQQPIGQPLSRPANVVVSSVAFSPDGKILAFGSFDNTIILTEVATGQSVGAPLGRHTGPVTSVVFSPDGKTLASGSDDDTVILWDVISRQPIGQPLTGPTGSVKSIAFSPDGKSLASGGCGKVGSESRCIEGQIFLWDLDLQSWIQETCQRVGRNFTLVEWEQYFPNEEYRKTCEQWPKHSSFYLTIAEKILGNPDETKRLEKALDKVRSELEIDPSIKDSVAESSNLVEIAAITLIKNETDAGKFKEALDLLDQAKSNNMLLNGLLNDTGFLSRICWFGSLQGYATQVLIYCERAVELAPDIPEFRDNRGLARVLTRNYSGAIEDFQFYIEKYEFMDGSVEQRQQWIIYLKAGKNPLTPEVLDQLENP